MMDANKIHSSIEILNQVFTNEILSRCKDKKVLLQLSGGLDTRATLSILLKNKIPFDAFTYCSSLKDIVIPQKITKKYRIYHILDYRKYEEIFKDKNARIFEDIFEEYDIVLNSTFLWIFDKYTHFELSERALDKKIPIMIHKRCDYLKKKYPNMYFLGPERETKNALDDIPIFYRVMRYPQVCIIRLNKPDLMRYPHTSPNIKHRIGLYCYRLALRITKG